MVNYRDNTGGMLLAPSAENALHERIGYRFAKRAFDVSVSLALILLLFVPMLIIAAAVSLDSKGGPVFRQKRVGLDGREFHIFKFRTMNTSAPSEVPTGRLSGSDSYITRVGSLLRRSSIDELPQLFNVLKGDMSFVGPRPLIRGETNIHALRSAAGVYSVRPGITGWAQINGRDEVSDIEKVRLDAEYVENRSVLFDMSILFKTVMVVVRGEGYCEGSGRRSAAE